MKGIYKSMGILLLSITVILSAATFLTTQNLVEPTSPNDAAFLMGHMTLKVIDENGNVRDYRQADNVIVTNGWDTLLQTAFTGTYDLAGNLDGTGGGAFTHIGIGTGGNTLPTSATLFGLPGELEFCNRVPITIFSLGSGLSGGGASLDFRLSAEFDAAVDAGCAGTAAIDEVGVFNIGTFNTGDMFARNFFTPPVPSLGPSDKLEIDWDFTFTGAAP